MQSIVGRCTSSLIASKVSAAPVTHLIDKGQHTLLHVVIENVGRTGGQGLTLVECFAECAVTFGHISTPTLTVGRARAGGCLRGVYDHLQVAAGLSSWLLKLLKLCLRCFQTIQVLPALPGWGGPTGL